MTVTLVVFLCVSPLTLLVVFVRFFFHFESLETMCPSLWESEQRGEASCVCSCVHITPFNCPEDHDPTVNCST